MISFTKMHGIGNDYIYINRIDDKNIIANDKIPSLTRFLSNRHFGVGADGVIFIEKSNIADFKMSIYNKDGSEAQMCGNGIRCLAKYVYEKKLTQKKIINIETLSGIKQAYLQVYNGIVTQVTICMGKPILDLHELQNNGTLIKQLSNDLSINIENQKYELIPVSMGNPHAIVFVKNTENFNVKKYGSLIERNNIFLNRTNVEFVQIIDRGYIKIRVWERGTGETLACGTGACAALAACAKKGFTRKNALVGLLGGNLRINWNNRNNKIYMTGTATKVFDGIIDY